ADKARVATKDVIVTDGQNRFVHLYTFPAQVPAQERTICVQRCGEGGETTITEGGSVKITRCKTIASAPFSAVQGEGGEIALLDKIASDVPVTAESGDRSLIEQIVAKVQAVGSGQSIAPGCAADLKSPTSAKTAHESSLQGANSEPGLS